MKFLQIILLVLGTFSLSLGLAATLPISQEASAQSVHTVVTNQSTVQDVSFPSGSFAKGNAGTWQEYDRNGNFRFTFREVQNSPSMAVLRNDELDVDIELNFTEQKIYARWPGRSRHVMHQISTMKHDLRLEERHIPAPAPAVPSENGMRFVSVEYDGGTFRDEGATWTDHRTGSDAIHIYDKLGQQGQDIFLYDDNSRRFFKVDIAGQKIYRAENGGPLTFHANITSMAAVSANPPTVTTEPGAMPFADREACIWSGGKVERAGMMGAERCTRAYSDGGNSCTDSTQCQGLCRTSTNNANSTLVRGVCQMDDNPFGCHSEVKNGRAEHGLCVD